MELITFIGVLALVGHHVYRAFADAKTKKSIESDFSALNGQIADLRVEFEELRSSVAEQSEELGERDDAFMERIDRIKGELAQQDMTTRTGYSAEELHPSVHNLPHNIISREHSSLPDVEYAE